MPLERNVYGHPLAGLLWERQCERILLTNRWTTVPNWELQKKKIFLSVYVRQERSLKWRKNVGIMTKLQAFHRQYLHSGTTKLKNIGMVPARI